MQSHVGRRQIPHAKPAHVVMHESPVNNGHMYDILLPG